MAGYRRLFLILFCCAWLIAQQPPTPPPDAARPDVVFSVTTSLVQVDAVVTDSKGHYVTDLTAADFQIEEDGKPQKITNFSYIQAGSKPAPRAPAPRVKSAGPALPPAPSAPLRREDVRRTIVLMVDDLGLSFESMDFVRRSLRKFVEKQMQPGDLAAVCRTAAGSGALQQFTSDKRILLAAINALKWDPRLNLRFGVFEPYGKYSQLAQASGDPEVKKGQGLTDTSTTLDAAYDAEQNVELALGTLGAVNYIVGALREMPGRKSVVLFSDGIALPYSAQLQAALNRLVDRANRAGTVIYTMLATGLQTTQLDAQDRIDSPAQLNRAIQVGVLGGRDAQYNMSRQGLAEVAELTGGVAYEPENDLNWGLDRMLEDQQGYYLIGYKPAPDIFDEKHGARGYHKIVVKVLRAGLHARSRTGFFGATDEETRPKYDTPLEQLHAAMLSPFQSTGVRLRLTALYAEVPKQGAVVRNLLHIEARDLTFREMIVGEQWARAEILAVAMGADGQPVATLAKSWELRVDNDRLQEGLAQGALYTLDVPIRKRGAYQIHVAVRDSESGKVGSASQFLVIPDPKKERVTLTSVVLQQGDRPPGTPAYAGMTPATRQFHAGGQVEYFCMVEKSKKPLPAGDLQAQIHILRDGRNVYSGPANLTPMDSGGLAITGDLKLGEKMTPGDYYLGVVAADRAARKNAVSAQWTDFEILP